MGTIARNEITGKVLKSDPPTQHYRDRWDLIYSEKSGLEWMEIDKIKIITPTGWDDDGISLKTPIKYKDFLDKVSRSDYEKMD